MCGKRWLLLALLGLPAWAGGRAAEAPLANIAGPAEGTQVRADTEFSAKYSAANAVDGRLAPGDGCWYSQDWTKLPCALTFTFAEEEDVRRVVLYQARWNGSMYHTRDFAVETSADGKAWARAATGQLPDDNEAKVAVALQARTRRLRIVVLTSYNPQQTCGLTEVEILAAGRPSLGAPEIRLNGRPAPAPTSPVCGLCFSGTDSGPQVALFPRGEGLLACVRAGEEVSLSLPVAAGGGPLSARAEVALAEGQGAQVELALGTEMRRLELKPGAAPAALEAQGAAGPLALRIRGAKGESAVRLRRLQVTAGGRTLAAMLAPPAAPAPGPGAPPLSPILRPALEQALVEWDWRMQDGIGTERNPSTTPAALAILFRRGDMLLADLEAKGHAGSLGDAPARWAALKQERDRLAAAGPADPAWETLYLKAHRLRREIVFRNPLAQVGPLLFVKQVPGAFSHQLTQVYGRYARPGGGLFVLDKPGASMACRQLAAGALPMGSYMNPEVSFDGRRILFAYCKTDAAPANTIQGEPGRYYHLYEMRADVFAGAALANLFAGAAPANRSGLKQLTDGPFNDFSPRCLPDGKLLFISTRRRGWHRCGSPGCENYTLTVANADGSDPHPISFHETQEWDPVVTNEGRLLYTRWDYVDRHPVFYEHLWSAWPDGSRAATYYGNTTFNPIGTWEPRPIPGSTRIMATAAAHHAMTAGSIVLLDVAAGVDGLAPITRLTPDALFPESETPVGHWFSRQPNAHPETPESLRWPGHCYKSPYPLSEDYFLAAYSFVPLVGEPTGNAPNMFGIYLCDRFGNKELLYRDPNIGSLWPVPLRPRVRPPVLPSTLDAALGDEGIFTLEDVYAGLPGVPRGTVKALRVVQVLPKSTPGIDNPPVGRPRGAPGKQVLGTVPVEPDGSACFRVPARIEVAFQALDERGLAVQVMRSGTYLQPGERASCVGCHESRTSAPPAQGLQALAREPSVIKPGPPGSRPFSYPLLVQPVLDRHCVSCHAGAKPAGGVALTGTPEGRYTVSYNALAARVPYSDLDNGEPLSQPGRFGARGSKAMSLLLAGHYDVRLSPAEIERLATWMDSSALFYGTFDPADQARQQRGEQIQGPALE